MLFEMFELVCVQMFLNVSQRVVAASAYSVDRPTYLRNMFGRPSLQQAMICVQLKSALTAESPPPLESKLDMSKFSENAICDVYPESFSASK